MPPDPDPDPDTEPETETDAATRTRRVTDARSDGAGHGAERPDADRPPGDRERRARAGRRERRAGLGTLRGATIRVGTLVRRETVRFLTRPTTTVAPALVTNGLFIAVFGVILGARIGEVAGFDYLAFVLPGLMLLGTTTNAVQNAGFTVFHSRWEGYVDAVLSSPMSHAEQTVAWVLASATRGTLVGLGILLLGRLFTPVPLSRPVTLAAFLVVVSLLFGGVGVLIGLWADDFDQLNLFNQFLLRPLVFIGGVFYPITDLPSLLRAVTLFNPFFYMVKGFRAGLIGYAEATTRLSFAVLVATTAAVLLLAVGLVGRGYGLRS